VYGAYFALRAARCVSVLAAALLAALLADDEASVLPAADAAFAPVTLDDFVCAKALAAALFATDDADFDASVLHAAVAAFAPVRSVFAIVASLSERLTCRRCAMQLTVLSANSSALRSIRSGIYPD
jgi:hypothetical protein